MYLNQYWKDERLAFSSEENKVLTLSGDFAEKIWVPDTFFANDKKRLVSKSRIKNKLFNHSFYNCVHFQFSPRRDGAEQDGEAARGRGHHLRHEVHHHPGLHDGPALLPPGQAELHRGDREL